MSNLNEFLYELSKTLNSQCQFRDEDENIKWTPERIMNGSYCLYDIGIYVMCNPCKITLNKNLMKILEYKKLCNPCKGYINGLYRDKLIGDELSINGYIRGGIEHCITCSNKT
ncbi:MAG: hypothetical protein E6R13_07240 [Spirochaetes bacterium]|nr:MAG: hypothetical protein E6R13_07240 [Spirochaetota bacterium]